MMENINQDDGSQGAVRERKVLPIQDYVGCLAPDNLSCDQPRKHIFKETRPRAQFNYR
jgi:hypothetical protein